MKFLSGIEALQVRGRPQPMAGAWKAGCTG
jgi:hypothetical protein